MKYRRSCSVVGKCCKATIFNGYIKLCKSLPFIGNQTLFVPKPSTGVHNLHQFGLRPNRCRKGISPIAMMRLDVRRTSRLMPLETATLLEKGGRKTSITKTGNLCELSGVSKSPKTVSLTKQSRFAAITYGLQLFSFGK